MLNAALIFGWMALLGLVATRLEFCTTARACVGTVG